MVVIFGRNSSICGIFSRVRILRNDKSSNHKNDISTHADSFMHKRVKLQFIWQIKIECGFCRNKNDNHELDAFESVWCNYLVATTSNDQ